MSLQIDNKGFRLKPFFNKYSKRLWLTFKNVFKQSARAISSQEKVVYFGYSSEKMRSLRIILIVYMLFGQSIIGYSQSIIKMANKNGVFVMPCKVNGLSLNFILDTGASEVSISLTEALFMLKNGYLSENDLEGVEYYQLANGQIQEGTKVNLKIIEIGSSKIYNVKASILHSLDAPLLLGQSALSKLKKIELDYVKNTLTIDDATVKHIYDYIPLSNNKTSQVSTTGKRSYDGQYKFKTTFDNPVFGVALREKPDPQSKEIYLCPKDADVYVIDNTGELYYYVYVDGHFGYLSKGFLRRHL